MGERDARRDGHDELIAACQRVQTDWFRLRAERLGGHVWQDGPLLWTDGPDGQNLMFPGAVPLNPVIEGIERARANRRTIVGAWLSSETDASALANAGFERGWAPWWMAARLDRVLPPTDPRVQLGPHAGDAEAEQEHDGSGALLTLATLEPERVFYAAASVDGVHAGHAWSFVDGDVAGVFDMDVRAPFRRRGLGAGLLQTVAAAARDAGATTAVLNATPLGSLLYRAQGFSRIGEGATWWLHL